jgi:Arc/MetJ-type ribon-helix-helix transcriptional regulator
VIQQLYSRWPLSDGALTLKNPRTKIMALVVPSHLEPVILERVRSGGYHSPDAVLDLALQLLAWAEGDPVGKRQILRLALQVGIKDSEAGDVFDGEEVIREMRERARGETTPEHLPTDRDRES